MNWLVAVLMFAAGVASGLGVDLGLKWLTFGAVVLAYTGGFFVKRPS